MSLLERLGMAGRGDRLRDAGPLDAAADHDYIVVPHVHTMAIAVMRRPRI